MLLLKASQFLPGKDPSRWAEILSSEQSIEAFVRELKDGDFGNKGLTNTLNFVRKDNFDNLFSSLFAKNIDEEDARARYESIKPLIEYNLAPRLQTVRGHHKIISTSDFESILEDMVKTINKKPTATKWTASNRIVKLLRNAEIFAREHPKVIAKNRIKLREKYAEIIGPFLNANEGIMDKTTLDPSKGYRLAKLFGLKGKQKQSIERRSFTARTMDWEKATEFYKDIANKHIYLLPDKLYESNLVTKKGRKWKLNPYLQLIFDYDTLEEAAGNMTAGIKDSLYTQFGKGKPRLNFDAKIDRLLNVKDRVYSEEFVEWLLAKEWTFEDDYLTYEEDGEKDKSKNRYATEEQNILLGITEANFKNLDEFYFVVGSDKLVTLVEGVWEETSHSDYDLYDSLQFDSRMVNQFRGATLGLDASKEVFEPKPLSTTFNRSIEDLLNVLYMIGHAFGLDEENFAELYADVQQELVVMANEKLQDMITNQIRYNELQFGGTKTRQHKGIFDILLEKDFITEANA